MQASRFAVIVRSLCFLLVSRSFSVASTFPPFLSFLSENHYARPYSGLAQSTIQDWYKLRGRLARQSCASKMRAPEHEMLSGRQGLENSILDLIKLGHELLLGCRPSLPPPRDVDLTINMIKNVIASRREAAQWHQQLSKDQKSRPEDYAHNNSVRYYVMCSASSIRYRTLVSQLKRRWHSERSGPLVAPCGH